MPPNFPLEESHDLDRGCITGGPDGMPTLSDVTVSPHELIITRDIDESGSLSIPWRIKGAGQIISHSATLIEREEAYHLQLELSRGKVNQLRNQTSDWLMGGLNMPPALSQCIKDATLSFCRAVCRDSAQEVNQQAENALILAGEAADQLIHAYTTQVFQVRQQRQPRLETVLGCRVGPKIPQGEANIKLLRSGFNGLNISFSIHDILPNEGEYQWEAHDELVEWASSQGYILWGGPLIDFSSARIPSWLWLWERDRNKIAKLLSEYALEVIDRYKKQISIWQLTSGGNIPGVLSFNDDELLWLVLQVGDAVRREYPDLELIVSVGQPWGEYMAGKEHTYSPFVFVDTLLRSGLQVGAIDLEVVMGVNPRGSYCRDLLDFSRLLDLFALLGVPLQVTLGYPAETTEDELADQEYNFEAGYWRGGIDPSVQSEWAGEFASLALCKPYVRAVQWVQLSDAQKHQFPNCGLVDKKGKARPAMQKLKRLREKYLK